MELSNGYQHWIVKMSVVLNLKSFGILTPLRLHLREVHNRCRIGNRDWVGFGTNGSANYKDDAHFPFPAVRFKENTRDICVKYQFKLYQFILYYLRSFQDLSLDLTL